MEQQVTNFVTFKELVMIVLASSGILTLAFTILSKLFDKASRVLIMDEIKKIDEKYQKKVEELAKEVNLEFGKVNKDVQEFRVNYLDRFTEQKDLIVEDREIQNKNHSDVMNVLTQIITEINYLKANSKKD